MFLKSNNIVYGMTKDQAVHTRVYLQQLHESWDDALKRLQKQCF